MEELQRRLRQNRKEVFKACAAGLKNNIRPRKENLARLRHSGYCQMPIPVEFGGEGLNLDDVMFYQRQLSYFSAPLALDVGFHLSWLGLASHFWRSGDKSLEWIFREAIAGKFFSMAFDDFPSLIIQGSTNLKAEKIEGGYLYSGVADITMMSEFWSYLGVQAKNDSTSGQPHLIHAFLSRDSDGYSLVNTDRAADDDLLQDVKRIVLDNAFISDQFVLQRSPWNHAMIPNKLLKVWTTWALLSIANCCLGQAQYASDLLLEKIGAQKRLSFEGVDYKCGEILMNIRTVETQLNYIAQEMSLVEVADSEWMMSLLSAKCHAMEQSLKVIQNAFQLVDDKKNHAGGELEIVLRYALQLRKLLGSRQLIYKTMYRIVLGQPHDSVR